MQLRLKQRYIWLRRVGHCRGFGIQSPTDYAFVCKVVNGKGGRMRYADFKKQYPGAGYLTMRISAFYRRLAEYRRPRVIVDHCPPAAAYREAFMAGCPAARIVDAPADADHIDLLRVNADAEGYDLLLKALEKCDDDSIVIVEGIKCNARAREIWRAIRQDGRFTVTFDLYYLGVAFTNSKRYKQNYIINF